MTTTTTTAPPSAFNQGIFFDPAGVFYGTDNGYQDGSFGEFADRLRLLGARGKRACPGLRRGQGRLG